ISVGMLFDPEVVVAAPWLLLGLLGVVLLAKPLAALVIVWALRYSPRTALTVAIALAQVGEFSFILGNEAMEHRLLSAEGQSLLVACALISITLNPLLFRAIDPLERRLRGKDRLWRAINRRSQAQAAELNAATQTQLAADSPEGERRLRAVVIGYGPIGRTVSRILREFQIETVIVDLNVDTVRELAGNAQPAIYGDATRREILEAAGIPEAKYLMVTVPDLLPRSLAILAAKNLNPDLRVFTRARYIQERAWLEEVGATEICTEESETAIGLAMLVLREVGADEDRIRVEIERTQRELGARQTEEVVTGA
ncbi:MAG: NAD-binding protein, partial [Planctomycetaceae bacterium]